MKPFGTMAIRSMKRRKKELRYVAAATFIAALFLSGMGLFQNIMNHYVREVNRMNYGNWILSAVRDYENPEAGFQKIEHPYLGEEGICTTGNELFNKNMEATGIYPGSADKSFWEIGNLRLYEGRLPENEKEVVMDLPSLAALGYSYELGQTIHLQVLDKETLSEGDYVLTGTVKSIASNWIYDPFYALPGVFLTEEGLETLTQPHHTTYFYALDEAYQEIDIQEFAIPFYKGQASLQINTLAYASQVWESPEMFAASEWILLCIAMLAVGCLFMFYISRRRIWYYKLRRLGASRGQIRKMILTEGLYGTLPWAVLGLILPYMAGFTICQIVSRVKNLPNFFSFSLPLFLQQAGGIFGILLFGIICAWITGRDKNLESNTKEVSTRQRERIRKNVEKKITPFLLWKRQRSLHLYRNIADILFSIFVCSLLLLCVNQLVMAWKTYQGENVYFQDFEAEKKVERTRESLDKSRIDTSEEYSMYEGVSQEAYAKMESLVGIQSIENIICDESHYLVWDGMEDSPVRKAIREAEKEGYSPLESTTWTLFRFADTWDCILKNPEQLKKSKVFSREAYEKGEQIIFIPGQYRGWITEENGEVLYEDTIQEGDNVWIESELSQNKIQVEVGAVLEWDDDLLFSQRPYNVIASRTLAEKIANLEQQSLEFNSVYIDFNRHASFEATEKQLASLFTEEKMHYHSNRERLTWAKSQLINSFSIYGTLFTVILAVYVMLQMNFQLTRNYDQRGRYRLLKRLGMEDKVFCRLCIKDMARQAAWILLGLPVSYGITYWQAYLGSKKQGGATYSEFLGEYTDNLYWQALIHWKGSTAFMENLILLVLLAVILLGIRYYAARQAIRWREERS